jgi:hypothetical protein
MGRQVKIIITQAPSVHVRCECGLEGLVCDLEAAIVWAFHEALRHGRGCRLDISVEIMLKIANERSPATEPPSLGII